MGAIITWQCRLAPAGVGAIIACVSIGLLLRERLCEHVGVTWRRKWAVGVHDPDKERVGLRPRKRPRKWVYMEVAFGHTAQLITTVWGRRGNAGMRVGTEVTCRLGMHAPGWERVGLRCRASVVTWVQRRCAGCRVRPKSTIRVRV